ncbi:hypothetical protein B0J14DRAFT_174444 [Halenospora varia]|nr:hypothetical protein B0J14DRAFT_174444 [Halenospora varia]
MDNTWESNTGAQIQPCPPPANDQQSFTFDFCEDFDWEQFASSPRLEDFPAPFIGDNLLSNVGDDLFLSHESGNGLASSRETEPFSNLSTKPAPTSDYPEPGSVDAQGNALKNLEIGIRGEVELPESSMSAANHQRDCSISTSQAEVQGLEMETWFSIENVSKALLIHGLPPTTDHAHLRSLMAWSSEFTHAQALDPSRWATDGFCSAVFHFSTYYGAESAKELLNGKSNFNATAYMHAEFATKSSPQQWVSNSRATSPVGKLKKRHKWSDDHISFLEKQYTLNPKPNTAVRREIALELQVDEKHVQTWFNNTRQRQKRGNNFETRGQTTQAVALSQKSLEDLAKQRSSSKSPIERFENSDWGANNEPSMAIIEAALTKPTRNYPLPWLDTPAPLPTPYKPSKSDLEEVGSASSAGSGHSSRSNQSANSKNSITSRRSRKAKYRGASKQQPWNEDVSIDLDCPLCGTAARFQLTPLLTNLPCLFCQVVIGKFATKSPAILSKSSGALDSSSLAFGPDYIEDIAICCPECYRRMLCPITPQCLGTPLNINCDCGSYNPQIIVSAIGHQQRYPCTYCQNTYKNKYAWERHETTKHNVKEIWTCCNQDLDSENIICIFCGKERSTTYHLDTHGFSKCAKRSISKRTYTRKDQFVQHLRSFHRLPSVPQKLLGHYKTTLVTAEKTWECGICGVTLSSWEVRIKHIGLHWDNGYSMRNWKEIRQSMELDPQELSSSSYVSAEDGHSKMGKELLERKTFATNLPIDIPARQETVQTPARRLPKVHSFWNAIKRALP